MAADVAREVRSRCGTDLTAVLGPHDVSVAADVPPFANFPTDLREPCRVVPLVTIGHVEQVPPTRKTESTDAHG